MKLDKQRFIVQRVYCWSVYEKGGFWAGSVHKYSGRSTATNSEGNQVLSRIFHDYAFMDFFKARMYCRKHPDKYSFCWQRNDSDI